jgi:hypothetical protein
MSYYNFYNGKYAYPLAITENKLNGLYNEYAELNDVAARNNSIYFQNLLDNDKKCKSHKSHYIPSIYSLPYYTTPYYSPYINPYYTPYYSPYLNPYYPPFRPYF